MSPFVRSFLIAGLHLPTLGCRMFNDEVAERELLAIAKELRPCMVNAEVDAVLNRVKTTRVTRSTLSGGGILLTTPLAFGATNWHLLLEQRDEKLVSIRFRTEDGTWDHPDTAPRDLFCNQ